MFAPAWTGIGGPRLCSPPRRVAYTTDAVGARWVWGVGTALLLAMLLWIGFANLHELERLRDHGEITQGSVVKLSESGGRSHHYYVTVAFYARGARWRHRASVARSNYLRRRLGRPALVTYLPADPRVARLGRVDAARVRDEKSRFATALGVVLVLLGGLIGYGEWFYRRQFRLAERGIPLEGIVSRVYRGSSHARYCLQYRFTRPDGGTAVGKAWLPLSQRRRYPEGAPICVLCNPANPADHTPLPALSGVRILEGWLPDGGWAAPA